MGTRANIVIKDQCGQCILYRHMDGTPEYTGVSVKQECEDIKQRYGYLFGEDVANALVKSPEYSVASSIHGDIEYLYIVDCEKETVNAYRVPAWDMTLEEIAIQKHRVKIP